MASWAEKPHGFPMSFLNTIKMRSFDSYDYRPIAVNVGRKLQVSADSFWRRTTFNWNGYYQTATVVLYNRFLKMYFILTSSLKKTKPISVMKIVSRNFAIILF